MVKSLELTYFLLLKSQTAANPRSVNGRRLVSGAAARENGKRVLMTGFGKWFPNSIAPCAAWHANATTIPIITNNNFFIRL